MCIHSLSLFIARYMMIFSSMIPLISFYTQFLPRSSVDSESLCEWCFWLASTPPLYTVSRDIHSISDSDLPQKQIGDIYRANSHRHQRNKILLRAHGTQWKRKKRPNRSTKWWPKKVKYILLINAVNWAAYYWMRHPQASHSHHVVSRLVIWRLPTDSVQTPWLQRHNLQYTKSKIKRRKIKRDLFRDQ